jgi:hypothetical protein
LAAEVCVPEHRLVNILLAPDPRIAVKIASVTSRVEIITSVLFFSRQNFRRQHSGQTFFVRVG